MYPVSCLNDSGSQQSKSYGLGRAGFPRVYLPLPVRRFPIKSAFGAFPSMLLSFLSATRLPLSPHCNPLLASKTNSLNSLGDFHKQSNRLLASFAGKISKGNRRRCLAMAKQRRSSIPFLPTQGRLLYTQHLAFARGKQIPLRTAMQVNICPVQKQNSQRSLYHETQISYIANLSYTETGLHANRDGFFMPLKIALNTQAQMRFPPAPTPNWAFEANTRGFKDVPFKGFLGPSW